MPLAAGTRLGPYEVLAPIGAGGMGEVYKARDTRLDRTVAIKVLPGEVSADPDRRARLEREARTIAGLNHPNICALHDVGEHDGSMFLVMEHIEGETLASRLERGPLPIEQALGIAAQIAGALAAAHRGGIVHRDLKPGNVMLTRSGARLLDFGLARLAGDGGDAALGHLVSAPTISAPLTKEGTIVGTLHYMAPEQVEGKPADARTDVWALGVILYEMVAGKRAFEGASGASLIAAILEREPAPLGAIQPLTPPGLDRLVRTCLAKDPDRRFHSAHDLALEIGWLSEAIASPSAPALATAGPPRRRWRGVLLGAVGGAVVAAAAVWTWMPSPPRSRPVVRFTIEVPVQRRLAGLALSPDGRDLVYVGIEGENAALFRRSRDQFTDAVIPGTEGALSPFFSPDGQWVAFFRASRLLKVRLDGRDLTTICVVPADAHQQRARVQLSPTGEGMLYSGFWGGDGTIVFSAGYSALWRVSSLGAEPVPITKLDPERGELAHIWPVLLPGSKMVLHSVLTGMIVDAVPTVAVSLQDGATRPVLPDARGSVFLPSGHLLYADAGSLVSVRFDPDRLEARGTPVPMVDDVAYAAGWRGGSGWAPLFTVSPQGDLAYATAQPEEPSELLRLWRDGRSERIAELPPGFRGTMSVTPDGRRMLLYKIERGRMSLWLMDVQRGALSRIEDEGNAHSGVWSADGRRLAFSFSQGGTADVFVRNVDGTGTPERLVASGQHKDPASWSRDGRWLAYAEISPRTGFDLWALDLTTRAPVPLRQTSANEQYPAISPDGAWLAYSSDETGRFEVYVQTFPGGASRQQVSIDGGSEPVWGLDGTQLYFRNGPQLFSVPVRDGVPSSAEKPVRILEFPFKVSGAFGPAAYAVAPNGQYFYLTRAIAQPPVPQKIRVVLGWSEEVAKQFRE